MLETLWPRLRSVGRLAGFGIGLAVIAGAALSAMAQPTFVEGSAEPTRQLAPELFAILGACLWMLLVTRL